MQHCRHLDQPWVHACPTIAGGVVVAAACLVGRWLFNQHQDKQQLQQQHTVIEPAVVAAASKCQKNSFWPLRVGGQAAFAGSRDRWFSFATPACRRIESTVSCLAALSLQSQLECLETRQSSGQLARPRA
jgi:hypothetical protein